MEVNESNKPNDEALNDARSQKLPDSLSKEN